MSDYEKHIFSHDQRTLFWSNILNLSIPNFEGQCHIYYSGTLLKICWLAVLGLKIRENERLFSASPLRLLFQFWFPAWENCCIFRMLPQDMTSLFKCDPILFHSSKNLYLNFHKYDCHLTQNITTLSHNNDSISCYI